MKRRKTRKIKIGSLYVGGDAPVSVQSMAKTDTRNVGETVRQIKRLENAGCELVRVAVPDMEAAKLLGRIKSRISIPLAADIHFDYRLALEAIKQGVDKLRINPGNIGVKARVRNVAEAAGREGIPIRIGVNSGSLEKSLAGRSRAGAMAASAMKHARVLENAGFHDIIISLKSPDVSTTVNAYRIISAKTDYPLHLGVTEAGAGLPGTVKSSLALGILLSEGIGDTIRVSLTDGPVEEVRVGYEILKSLGLRKRGPEVISCPTCGRCKMDIIKITNQFHQKCSDYPGFPPLKVAIMGCAVNGPGEAREADIGIAGGKNAGTLFKNGRIIKKVKEKDIVEVLIEEMKKCAQVSKARKRSK